MRHDYVIPTTLRIQLRNNSMIRILEHSIACTIQNKKETYEQGTNSSTQATLEVLQAMYVQYTHASLQRQRPKGKHL